MIALGSTGQRAQYSNCFNLNQPTLQSKTERENMQTLWVECKFNTESTEKEQKYSSDTYPGKSSDLVGDSGWVVGAED